MTRYHVTRAFRNFIHTEAWGGVVMMFCAALALIAANSRFGGLYGDFTAADIMVGINSVIGVTSVYGVIKDVLMAFFFLLVGMELKRELAREFASDRRQLLLPLFAAIGGMAVPALVYFAVNFHHPENWRGWAIPSATDIAFALGVMVMLGRAVPHAAKVLLLSIAIFDDIGAVIIIALFYNRGVVPVPLLWALAVAALLFLCMKKGVVRKRIYLALGVLLWFCLYRSGIHPTLAGVVTGLAIPAAARKKGAPKRPGALFHPLEDFTNLLHPWVAFFILPLFAFTSAGIVLRDVAVESLVNPVTLGAALGLFLGKPVGIFGASLLMVKLGIVEKPAGLSWRQMLATSSLAGIGFTLSIFIAYLSFGRPFLHEEAVLGVLLGSLSSAVLGSLIFKISAGRQTVPAVRKQRSGIAFRIRLAARAGNSPALKLLARVLGRFVRKKAARKRDAAKLRQLRHSGLPHTGQSRLGRAMKLQRRRATG